MKRIIYVITVFLMACLSFDTFGQQGKPRVIAMTDGEIDDRSSMVRFLYYTNDIELEAIIQTSSVYQRNGWSSDKWIEKQIDAYEQIYPNLIIHDPDYPTANELRSKLFVGDEDSSHLVVDRNSARRLPGMEPVINPSNWRDTPGSDKIVEVLLKDDPRPVHIQAWGGGNTALRAFDKIKSMYPDQYDKVMSKVVMYHIWYQDGAGHYIERNHPKVTMVLCYNFSGTWAYGSQRYTYQFVADNLHKDHGPLAALYPQDYISEGDSPAFLYSIENGLRSYEDPTYGGWGGRFYKVYGNVYRDHNKGTFWHWVEYANRDFEARLRYGVTDKFENANHKPVITVKGGLDRTVKSGELVELEAVITDPDNPERASSALWWQYEEAGTYEGMVLTSDTRVNKLSFIAPVVTRPSTVHMIVETTDRGTPALTSFARVIITVLPAY